MTGDWKKDLGKMGGSPGGAGQKKCKQCGKSLKPDSKFDTCFECGKKGGAGSTSFGTPVSLPPEYLSKGYFDEKGNLREGIFKDEAKEVARVLAAKRMTSTSFRAFYNKVKAIENKYKTLLCSAGISKGDAFESIKASLFAFERDVAYQVSRGVVPEEFRKFIVKNAEIAKNGPKEFKGLIEHFLSVLAYFKDASK